MKTKIGFNIWVAMVIFILCFTIILSLIFLVNYAKDYYEYNKYVLDNKESNVDFYYNCDDYFNSAMYSCPTNLQLKNLTGHYCNQTKICENSFKLK